MIMSMMMTASMITIIIMMMKNLMKSYNKNKMNKTPFECGFSNTLNKKKMPMSIQFFILSTMFIIFDIEISILISMVKPMNNQTIMEWFLPTMMFLMTMIMGISYEWKESAMYWTK